MGLRGFEWVEPAAPGPCDMPNVGIRCLREGSSVNSGLHQFRHPGAERCPTAAPSPIS